MRAAEPPPEATAHRESVSREGGWQELAAGASHRNEGDRDIGPGEIIEEEVPQQMAENQLSNKRDLNGGSLLRMFTSEVFDAHFHMYYLYWHQSDGVHDYLVNLLYKRPDEEIHFYLPQLCQLAIVRYGKTSITRFLLDKAARSMHLALKANWLFQAAVEDRIADLSETANKMREEIEMAVVNSKPLIIRDTTAEPGSEPPEVVQPTRTPDLFLRRRAVKYLTRIRRQQSSAVLERATAFLNARFPEFRQPNPAASAPVIPMDGSAESTSGPVEAPNVLAPAQADPPMSPVPQSPPPSPIMDACDSPCPSAPANLVPETPHTPEQGSAVAVPNSGPAPVVESRRTRKGKIAPGFVSHTGPVSVAGGKVKLSSVYTKLHTPFNYTSFSRESHSALLNDNEMQPYIIKQRRSEYFDTVGRFISMLIEISEKTATEPDRNLRAPLLRAYLSSLNEWMLCRRCIVAASEGIFAMTGLLIPFTNFGVEPERATYGVPTPYHAPFLTHPTAPLSLAPLQFSSVQILRVCTEECKVFSSKKRAPYLLVFELADLDEDINKVNVAAISLPTRTRRDSEATVTTVTEEELRPSLSESNAPEISWDSLHVYSCVLKELKVKGLFVPPFVARPLAPIEVERIEDPKTRKISCEVCLNCSLSEISRVPVEEYTPDFFPFKCPSCGGTKLWCDAMNEDQMLVTLRRSLGVQGTGRSRTHEQSEPPQPPPVLPPYDPVQPVCKDEGLVTPTSHREDLPSPVSGDEERPQSSSTGRPATRQRRASLLVTLGLSSEGAASRSHSAGRDIQQKPFAAGRRLSSPEGLCAVTDGPLIRRSSSLGPTPRGRKTGTNPPKPPERRREESRPKKPAASGSGLPNIANFLGSAAAGLVKGTSSKPSGTIRSSPSSASAKPDHSATGDFSGPNELQLVIEGESAQDQAIRIRKILWPEPWEEVREKIRQESPYGNLESWRLGAVFVKGNDDVRQELLASQLIRQFKAIFDEANLQLWLRPLEILVTGSHSGIMEYIPDTHSIDAIKKKFNVDSIHKVFEAAFADNPYEAKKNFIESHAAYSLLGYLLQVKDRHNGNLLLDNKGHIVHIDFGFMLCNSPGYLGFESSPFKLSAELMAVIDGNESPNFEYFKELMVRGFLETRKHSERILLVLQMMLSASKMPCFAGTPKLAVEGVAERFMPGQREDACITRVLDLVEQSVCNWRTHQYDAFQRLTNGIL